MLSMLDEMRTAKLTALSSEEIVNLIEQHLASPKAARLPVLVVAAAYQAASEKLGERVLPLESHNAADLQTGALGDIEITLIGDDQVVTTYEMKMRQITREDIDRAVHKIANIHKQLDNYIFITTDPISEETTIYAKSLYRKTGTEFVILNCIAFLRHFLHLFHRIRIDFLDAYQELLLAEPNSAVRPALKESFLALRRAADSSDDEGS
jgi:DNA adenine methylase